MTAIHTDLQVAFKAVMASVATPVSVVTALVDDHPYGTTVSAFLSLSMDPPMVLVSMGRESETLETVRASGKFGLNLLGAQQSAIATAFATKGGAAKFDGTSWETDHDAPRIANASGWIACSVNSLVEGGDHIAVLGNVVAAETSDEAPLIYYGRLFGTYVPHTTEPDH